MPRLRLPIPVRAYPGAGVGRGTMSPTRAATAPVELYRSSVQVPLTGAQAVGVIPDSGSLELSVGPTGLGTVWYPAAAAISSSVSPYDPTSSVSVYVGPATVPSTLQGQILLGGIGVVALAIPQLTPGSFITVEWTDATVGSIVSVNVTGTAQMLTR